MSAKEQEKLAMRVRVQIDFVDLAQNELRRIKKYLRQEKQPLNPERYRSLVDALDLLQSHEGPK